MTVLFNTVGYRNLAVNLVMEAGLLTPVANDGGTHGATSPRAARH